MDNVVAGTERALAGELKVPDHHIGGRELRFEDRHRQGHQPGIRSQPPVAQSLDLLSRMRNLGKVWLPWQLRWLDRTVAENGSDTGVHQSIDRAFGVIRRDGVCPAQGHHEVRVTPNGTPGRLHRQGARRRRRRHEDRRRPPALGDVADGEEPCGAHRLPSPARRISHRKTSPTRLARNPPSASDILGNLGHAIKQTDVRKSSTRLYRLRTLAFADRAPAQALCAKLKRRDIECIVVSTPDPPAWSTSQASSRKRTRRHHCRPSPEPR